MSKKKKYIRIRKNDTGRAILTEVLPYEVPIGFSTEGIYKALKSDELKEFSDDFKLRIFDAETTIPYGYRIRKNGYEFRDLSLIHPSYQVKVTNFYAKYEHLIVGLCGRSSFSLRAPAGVASYYAERSRFKNSGGAANEADEVEELSNGFSAISPVATSYFVYRRYAFLYRFYDSREYIELEKKYKFLAKLDISSCFAKIYTHTIAWAVKSKAHAKKNKEKQVETFEKSFDELMQGMNYGETAGILVGAEISRIFAEIILQRVDLDITESAAQQKLIDGSDYTIRRYVDDYFIFCNSESVRDLFKRIIGERLSSYKLSINTAKTADYVRPFVTPESVVRTKISAVVKEFFDRHRQFVKISVDDKEQGCYQIKRIHDVSVVASQFIGALKRAVGENGSYDYAANYFFGTVKRLLAQLLSKEIKAEKNEAGVYLYYFLTVLIDVVFFYYSMSPRMRQTYLVAEIIQLVRSAIGRVDPDLRDSLVRKIVHESRLVISAANLQDEPYKIETMNLLLVVRCLGDNYIFDEDIICKIFEIERKDGEYIFPKSFGYFELIFLMSYVGGLMKFDSLRHAVGRHISIFFEEIDWASSAEKALVFLDAFSCPHIDPDQKLKIAKSILKVSMGEYNLNANAHRLIELVEKRSWYFDWRWAENLSSTLRKKELRAPYL